MDFLADFIFDKKKPFTPIAISGGSTNGRIVQNNTDTDQHLKIYEEERATLEHDVEKMRQQLDDRLIQSTKSTDNYEADGQNCEIYKKYNFDKKSQKGIQLPIYALKRKILSKIAEYPSVVIEGSPGCGKSTQVPQMILDDAKEHQKPCNIIVTQPRRIAARSIADRVCTERGWDLGKLVGYQIGLEKTFVSEDTRILFCTTGVLLEKLIQTKTLSHFTHIILDEVHERDKDMDFLFIIIRMLMAKEATNTKIILMSATIETLKFANFFNYYELCQWVPAPIIKVDKPNQYNVQTFYLDSFERLTVPNIDFNHPGISDEMLKLTLRMIKNIHMDLEDGKKISSILIFLPGIYEIGRLYNVLTDSANANCAKEWKIFILHSQISTEEQQSVFTPVESNIRKIILSTNIAESSITVPDVGYVIDFCLMKYLRTDAQKNCTRLEMAWASKNNCRQRTGRAGRVANGRCYRMVPFKFFECYLKESPTPELLLTPLENVILKAKTFEMGAPHEILGLAMDRPKVEDIKTTMLTLKELGALLLTVENQGFSSIDGDLTFLGRVMSNLPIDVRSTRLIAIGYCFGVLEECIIMAAGLTTKSIFKVAFGNALYEYSRRLEWSNGTGSDLFAILNAFKIWTMKYNQGAFGTKKEQQKSEQSFCKKHFLDVRSLNECHVLVQELTHRLDKLGIREATGVNRVRWTEQEKVIILKVVIAGAFYPNFFSTAPITNPMIERDIFSSMNGRDPDNTVLFTGFRNTNIRQLYVESIRDLFRDTVVDAENISSVKISFDADSEKVFVTFDRCENYYHDDVIGDWDTMRSTIPGKTLTEVYKAVKMRKSRMSASIAVMNTDAEIVLAEKLGLGFSIGSTFSLKEHLRDDVHDMCVPNIVTEAVCGTITHVENCSKFWFQPESERQMVEEFNRELNENPEEIIQPCTDFVTLNRTQIIAVRNSENNQFYRARLIAFDYDQETKMFKGFIRFMDTGRTQKCQNDDIYIFIRDIDQAKKPPRCFQSRLAEIQASTANVSGGNMWDQEAIQLFQNLVDGHNVKAEIYSVVNGTANVFVWINETKLNDVLIQKGFGEFCEENFLSKNNRWKRNTMQKLSMESTNVSSMEDYDEYYPIADIDPVRFEKRYCDRIVKLNGPRSPLEAEVYSVLQNSSKRSVHIDAHSVNNVLLTPLQQDSSIKYVVAAHISESGGRDNEITMHETTLLPSIRGFGALMAMIFCPAMDLKRDQWKTRYVSLRTGLGYSDETNCPYFPEHDAVFPLDFEFTEDDLATINQMRYTMDTLLFSLGNKTANDAISATNKLELMKKLKDRTLSLLTKCRKAVEIHSVAHDWKEYESHEFTKSADVYDVKSIFPVHGLLCLKESINKNDIRRLKQHCIDLRNMTTAMPRAVTCELCATEIENVAMLRTHLMSRLHMERENQVGFKDAE